MPPEFLDSVGISGQRSFKTQGSFDPLGLKISQVTQMGNFEDEGNFSCQKSMNECYEEKAESVNFYHTLQRHKKST